jgi:solute carrier family 12 (sodium/potassium/chloride transporter), member 2
MAALLSKFRISYSDLVVLSDLDAQPKECTKSWFDNLIRNFKRRNNPSGMAYQTDLYRQFS